MIDGKSYFDEPVKKNFRIYDNTEKKCDQSKIIQLVVYQITTILINTIKMAAIDSSKQEALDADSTN